MGKRKSGHGVGAHFAYTLMKVLILPGQDLISLLTDLHP